MFFRRVFGKKEPISAPSSAHLMTQSTTFPRTPSVNERRGVTVLQLTPLWEYVVRTHQLPNDVNPREIFLELSERLTDPEWQVRQHALRVLVDVIPVLGDMLDVQMDYILEDLIGNLGHTAPAVRKGALDTLNIYLQYSQHSENTLRKILDLGLENNSFDHNEKNNVAVGLILSLPALIYPTLISNNLKHSSMVANVIQALDRKLVQVTYQEVALRVLVKIRDMIGQEQFQTYLNDCQMNSKRDFDLLCQVYGLSFNNNLGDSGIDLHVPSSTESKNSHWTVDVNQNTEEWNSDSQSEDEDDKTLEEDNDNVTNNDVKIDPDTGFPMGKVIMETEIKIDSETAVTMRILEEQSNGNVSESDEEVFDNSTGVMKVFTDSEYDEDFDATRRTPRRVRFGGEIVKMRTPDSDNVPPSDAESELTAAQSDITGSNSSLNVINEKKEDSDSNYSNTTEKSVNSESSIVSRSNIPLPIVCTSTPREYLRLRNETTSENSTPVKIRKQKKYLQLENNVLSKRALSDNCISNRRSPNLWENGNLLHSDGKAKDTTSAESTPSKIPKSSKIFCKTSRADDSMSPIPIHNEIEVLHNLQRSPTISPSRSRRNSDERFSDVTREYTESTTGSSTESYSTVQERSAVENWEDANVVDGDIIRNLRDEENWHNRQHGFESLAIILNSSDKLESLQPYLSSLLAMLLITEPHSTVSETKRDVLRQLILNLPEEYLHNHLLQILTGLCKNGGPNSITIAKCLMQRLSPGHVVNVLLSEHFLQARSAKFREHAIQMVLFSTMTFPSTEFNIPDTSRRVVLAATDRKRRVRQCALDTLAVLCQISSPTVILEVTQEVAKHRHDKDSLLSAVKARLVRKQLPSVGVDGSVVYALRIASPRPLNIFGADVDWIVAGSGSVSPGSREERRRIVTAQNWSDDSVNSEKDRQEQKERIKLQELDDSFKQRNGTDSTVVINGGPKVTRRPHELVAIGVGVRPNSEDQVTWTLVPMQNNNEKNKSSVFVSGPVPMQASTVQLQSADGTLYPAYLKLQAQSLPVITYKGTRKSGIPLITNSANRYSLYGQKDENRRRILNHPNATEESNQAQTHLNHHEPSVVKREILPSSRGHHSSSRSVDTSDSQGDDLDRDDAKFFKLVTIRVLCSLVSTYLSKLSKVEVKYEFPEYRKSYVDKEIQKIIENPMSKLFSPQIFAEMKESLQQFTDLNDTINMFKQMEARENKTSPLIDDGDRYSINSASRTSRQAFATKTGSAPNSPESGNSLPKISPGSYTRQATTQTGNSQLRHQKNHRKTPSPALIGDGVSVEAITPGQSSPTLSKSGNNSANLNRFSKFLESIEKESFEPQEQEGFTNESLKLEIDSKQKSAPPEIQDENQENVISIIEFEKDPGPQFLDLRLVEQQLIEELQKHIISSEEAEISKTPSLQSINVSTKSIKSDESPISVRTPMSARTKTPVSVSSRTPTSTRTSTSARTPEIAKDSQEVDNDIDLSDIKSQASSPSTTTQYSAIDNGSLISVSGLSDMDIPALADAGRTSALLRRRKQIIPLPKSSSLFKNKVKPSYTIKTHVDNSNQALDNPKDIFIKTVKDLESPDWEKTMYGFKYLSRLLAFHNDVIEQNMHVVITLIAKHVKNLRSQVARVACQTSGDLFSIPRKGLDIEMEDLAVPLLQRTADTNKFLRSDSIAALDVMCDNLPTNRVIGVLTGKGASHQNAIVRCACARLLAGVIIKLGYAKVFAMHKDIRDKILITGSKFLLEGSLETRGFAKEIFKELCQYEYFNKIIMDVIPTRTYRNIAKTLKCLQSNV